MKSLSLLTLVFAVSASFASQAAQHDEQHRVGAQLFGGSASYKSSDQDGDGVTHVYAYYNYQYDSTWALEAGINTGMEADEWKCTDDNDDKFTCTRNDKALFEIGANELDYDNFVLAVKGQYQLTENNYLYGKVGAHYYDYEIGYKGKNMVEEDGVSFLAEAGWQYDWDSGLSVNAAIQYMDMGDLDTSSLGVGVSYRF
ncbi:porin family protein [Pseudoalteromonas ardens]|uniref:Cell envelope biogenesis protein OmpA n=1 Tax=Pseudoalteromonas rubra TaxID=43658 RepID=A0A0L0ESA5_9GAMM|nr:porin family protein [Pseudoalteromonas sp. R96]KNC67362.1 cell envelope biogenesis protein OmpA [Pseudoalteromonas rubra]MDK1312320.1 porin family protein [Pseudoalteromonas sp. R96]